MKQTEIRKIEGQFHHNEKQHRTLAWVWEGYLLEREWVVHVFPESIVGVEVISNLLSLGLIAQAKRSGQTKDGYEMRGKLYRLPVQLPPFLILDEQMVNFIAIMAVLQHKVIEDGHVKHRVTSRPPSSR
jgi:hypothetical protein